MAPIPRCELRLPPSAVWRSPPPAAPASADVASKDVSTTAPPKPPASTRHTTSKRPSLTDAPTTKRLSDVGAAPTHAQHSQTRDSAEILEDAAGFSTSLTRDVVEVHEHKLHEGDSADQEPPVDDESAQDAWADEHSAPDACALTAQCRAEAEDEAEAAAAAGVSGEEEMVGLLTTAPPVVNVAATPGYVCADACANRPESPSSGYDVRAPAGVDKFGRRRKPAARCQGKYAPVEAYAGLWGGQKAWGARKQLELEMRTKRRLYERLHERNRRRRERERLRRQEKSRMMRCRDQAKIADAVENIAVNKAFHLRFNYNQRLPLMPSSMTEHLRRFKKPPFKFFPVGLRPCRKAVDEFAKLRVEEAKVSPGAITSAPTVKIKT